MTRLKPSKHRTFVWVAFLVLLVAACNASTTGSPTAPPASPPPAEVATGTPIAEIILQQEIVFGPGSFIYTDTQAGLADLSSYKATLTLTFDGTKDGQAQKWTRTYIMIAAQDTAAREWTIENTGDIPNPGSVFLAEMNGVDYQRPVEGICNATVIQEGDSFGDRLEPASFLTALVGAEAAGSETVNGVTADHYTFDQRALGEEGLSESTGEIWVATQGDYIVKYLRTTKGNADFFGEGLEGTLMLDYELTDVNNEITIELPKDCPPGLVDAPQLPDAVNVENVPGALSYTTSTSLAEAAAFYQEELPKLGWTPGGVADITESEALLIYNKDGQNMTVILMTPDGGTTVHILLVNSQQ